MSGDAAGSRLRFKENDNSVTVFSACVWSSQASIDSCGVGVEQVVPSMVRGSV